MERTAVTLILSSQHVMHLGLRLAMGSTVSKWFLLLLLVVVAGCAAPKSREHRAILQHQVEGRVVYREADGIQYYVECEHGLKYIGSSANEERIGPVDVCKGE